MIKRTVYVDVPKRLGDVTKEPTGFVDRTNSTMAFSDSTPDRTFTITPTGASFDVYSLGKKFKKTTAESVQITDTHGLWYIYYGSDGVLTASQSTWDFFTGKIFVALGYWDATNSSWIGKGEERHGVIMDAATHYHFHESFGAIWESGLSPDVIADGDGSLDSHAEIQSVSSGEIHDEDISLVSSEQTSYEIWYKMGSSGDWFKTTAGANLVDVTVTRPNWNEFTGGAWQRTEVGNNNFVLVHQFATNSTTLPAILIMGENEYTTKSAAQDAAPNEITTLISAGLPTAEFTEVATFIIQCRDAYTNSYNARVVSTSDGNEFIDFREKEKTGVGASTNHHGNLTGLGEDDHTQYLLVDGTRAMTGNLDMGTNNITNVGLVDGVDISNDLVPYTGATADVDLGSQNLTTTGDINGVDIYATTTLTENQTNGNFSNSFTGWTNSGFTNTADRADFSGEGHTLTSNFVPTVGTLYKIIFDASTSADGIYISLGGITLDAVTSGTDTYTYYVVATTTDPLVFEIIDVGDDPPVGYVDNVQILTSTGGFSYSNGDETEYKDNEIVAPVIYLNTPQLIYPGKYGNNINPLIANFYYLGEDWNNRWAESNIFKMRTDKIVSPTNDNTYHQLASTFQRFDVNSVSVLSLIDTRVQPNVDLKMGDNLKINLGFSNDVSMYFDSADWIFKSNGITANDEIHFQNFNFYQFDNPLKVTTINSGATQSAAGAAVNEIWKTSSHATLPDNVLLIGI